MFKGINRANWVCIMRCLCFFLRAELKNLMFVFIEVDIIN
jgi:hypothetical protein